MYNPWWLCLIGIFVSFSFLSDALSRTIANRKLVIRLTFLALLLFAFFYRPSELADAYRYLEELEYMKAFGASAAYEHWGYVYAHSYGFFLFMRLMAIFPTIIYYPVVMTLTYGILLYIFRDAVCSSVDLSKTDFFISYTFFLCCVNFGIITSNQRFCIGYSIGFLGIYLWDKNNYKHIVEKVFCLFLIFLPVTMHISAVIVPVVWGISRSYHVKWLRISSFLLPFALSFSDRIKNFLSPILGSLELYEFSVYKYDTYSNLDLGFFSRTSIVYYLMIVIILTIIAYCKITGIEKKDQNFNKVYHILLLLVCGFVPIRALFYRSIQFLIALTAVYYVNNRVISQLSKIGIIFILVLSLLMLVFYGRFSTYYYL